MKHVKLCVFPCVPIIALAILLLGTSIANAASTSSCGQWNVVSSPNAQPASGFTAIAAISTNDVWATGYTKGANLKPLIEHWDGSSWQIVASPKIKNRALFGIAAVSANDIWAVGNNDNPYKGFPLTEHWNGTQWSDVSSPNTAAGTQLFGVAAIASNDVWAVGLYFDTSNGSLFYTIAEHWNGTKWKVVYDPLDNQNDSFAGIAAISTANIWAVGATANLHPNIATLAEHWNGTQWSAASTPNVGTISQLNGVASVSTNDVWAVGQSDKANSPNALIEHWDGSHWKISNNPGSSMNGTSLKSVAALSASNVWAVGQSTNKSGVSRTFIEHWDGTQWSIVSSPNVGSMNNSLNGVSGR